MPYNLCPRHKRLYPLGNGCPLCAAQGAPRKYRSKNTRTAGRYDAQWQRLRAEAIRAQPYCSFCGSAEDLTGDHIIPLSKGGTNEASNVRVLCRSCNSRRGNR
ncbi:HNH endonuclease [Streptomyces sp. NRRL S-646]|uniref:HNH endonuclease n=1 Tax=Streptomyces sp. NRRL S-646 TaxID=1463917 RepID=UPI00099BC048